MKSFTASNDRIKGFGAPFLCFLHSCWLCSESILQAIVFRLHPVLLELGYFVSISVLGFLALKMFKLGTTTFMAGDLDLFFTAVSSVTVSSMCTVEMEDFSNIHLLLMTIMMFLGGEIFTSMMGLHLTCARIKNQKKMSISPWNNCTYESWIQIRSATLLIKKIISPSNNTEMNPVVGFGVAVSHDIGTTVIKPDHEDETGEQMKLKCIKTLIWLVSWYLLLVHSAGFISILIYVSAIKSARRVLSKKRINPQIFSIFTVVSTFSNCGFIPTNENMVVFKKNPGLLLILIPQILMGNTLFPICLRLIISFLEKGTEKVEYGYLLKNAGQVGYGHLFSGARSLYLAITAIGFMAVQMAIFCVMEWGSDATSGLSGYEKFVGSLFQVVNSRHAGESVVDLSMLSPTVLLLFILMMYLPPYTSYIPATGLSDEDTTPAPTSGSEGEKVFSNWDNLLFSHLTYITIFVMLVCTTERQKMIEDPLNFNLMSIVVEVVSAYGNVGFSMGYSCARQLNPDGYCQDAPIGFVGKWSDAGKFILILVMFFGKLRKHSRKSGKAWKLQ